MPRNIKFPILALLLVFGLLPAVGFAAKTPAGKPTNKATCAAANGVCSTATACWVANKITGVSPIGSCSDNWLDTTCCGTPPAQKAVGPALQPLIEDTCKKNPNDPTCLARAASATQASAGVSAGSPMTLANPLCPTGKADCVTLNALIGRFVAAFIGMVGALALIVFIYAGIMYMTAGSSDRVKQATDTMKYAIIGLALIMFAYVLVNFFFKALTSDAPKPPPETTGYAVPQGP